MQKLNKTLQTSNTTSKTGGGSPSSRGYRLNSSSLWLTWPQCPLEPEEAHRQLLEICPRMVEHIISQEHHKDQSLHLHAYLKLSKPCNFKRANCLDLREPDSVKVYHGNYQAARDRLHVIRYCLKEKFNHSTSMTEEEIAQILAPTTTLKPNLYQQVIALAKTGAHLEAVKMLETSPRGARDMLIYGDRIKASLRQLAMKPAPLLYNLLEDFKEWKADLWQPATHTLILSGPSNTGKTALAKALLPNSLFVTHTDQLRGYTPGISTGIIFDEGSFKHIPREAQIHVIDVQEDRTVHCRYAPGFLPSGTSRIITTNLAPTEILAWERYEIRRRCFLVLVRGINDYDYVGYPLSEEEHKSTLEFNPINVD